MSATAIRGTCSHCGRYVATYTRNSETARRAHAHKAWQAGIDDGVQAGLWRECVGSNQPVTA